MAKKTVDGLHFHVMDGGGLMSEKHTTTQRSGQGGGPGYDHDTEKHIHPTMEHAKQHLEDSLGHAFESNDDDEHAGFEGKKQKEEPVARGGKRG